MSIHPFHADRSGQHVLAPHARAWAPSHGTRRPATLLSRALSIVAWIVGALVAVGVYNNVVVDDTALRHETDELARQHAGCGDQCNVRTMQGRRTALGYEVSYEIEAAGTVEVSCRRTAIVAGAHECVTSSVPSR